MSKSSTQKALYVISFFVLIVLLLDIHNLSKASLFFMAPPDGSRWLAFIKIWLPELPFLLFSIAVFVSTLLKWHYILWAFPLLAIKTLHGQIIYLEQYHSYMTNFYLWFQLFSLFTIIMLIMGMIVGILRLYQIYKDRNLKK